MYRKILIPISNSLTVSTLIPELESLSPHLLDSTITLLHVQIPIYNTAVGMEAAVVTPGVEAQLEQEGLLILEQARRLLMQMEIPCQTVLKTGDAVQEICHYAEEELFDLIVVGRREKGLLESLLLTSVSDKLVQKAPTHVLVLK